MTEIYLIRHAQAEGNLYRMMQGHWDGDVTDVGLRQIDALAKRFKNVKIDAVYSSDLYRARLTASAITRYHELPLVTTPLLREINVGPWETLFFGNVFHDEPEKAELFIHDPANWRIDGAETYAEVARRAYGALADIARENDGKSVAVVSHGVTLRCLLAKITGTDLKNTAELPICRNTAVSKLSWSDGRFTAEYTNDFSHIVPLGLSQWSKTGDLRDEPFEPEGDRAWYEACYADAWLSAHGSLDGFSPAAYYESAAEHYRRDSGAVMKIFSADEAVGLIDLDTAHGEHAGFGWISFLYLKPEYRFQGYGVQLLGRAVAKYSALGRRALRLHVAEGNAPAVAFYRRFGFETLSFETRRTGKLLLMEKKLGGRRNA